MNMRAFMNIHEYDYDHEHLNGETTLGRTR